MFEWLANEISSVRTRKFHVVDGPLPPDERAALVELRAPLPPSYYEFIFRFGNAKLYRTGSQYRIQIRAQPIFERTSDEELRIVVGRTEETSVYFKNDLLSEGSECAVFEWRYAANAERRTAQGFEEWLEMRCKRARRYYSKREWREIEQGPPPFSARERAIVEARGQFRWRVIGISVDGEIQFEVHNGSNMVLPYLSIGIRGKRRGTNAVLDGGVWLPVACILPGQTVVIERDCYLEWVEPCDIEAFDLPDPEPEDRDRYWEFKQLPLNATDH